MIQVDIVDGEDEQNADNVDDKLVVVVVVDGSQVDVVVEVDEQIVEMKVVVVVNVVNDFVGVVLERL